MEFCLHVIGFSQNIILVISSLLNRLTFLYLDVEIFASRKEERRLFAEFIFKQTKIVSYSRVYSYIIDFFRSVDLARKKRRRKGKSFWELCLLNPICLFLLVQAVAIVMYNFNRRGVVRRNDWCLLLFPGMRTGLQLVGGSLQVQMFGMWYTAVYTTHWINMWRLFVHVAVE